MIEHQELQAISKRESLPDLLSDPTAISMARPVEVRDAPAVVGNNKEAVHEAVGTVKRSIAAIASLRLRRKASQRCAGSGCLGARCIQREMVRSETSKPNIKTSPWIRGAPQVGFSAGRGTVDTFGPRSISRSAAIINLQSVSVSQR
jgi:hypothetical protein